MAYKHTNKRRKAFHAQYKYALIDANVGILISRHKTKKNAEKKYISLYKNGFCTGIIKGNYEIRNLDTKYVGNKTVRQYFEC